MTGLRTSDYFYDLPQELIAQDPLADRSSSRLLVLNRRTGTVEHRHFTDIVEYLEPGDTLVLNDTKVIPARLLGLRVPRKSDGSLELTPRGGKFHEGGSEAEILLLKRLSEDRWETIVRPGKKLRVDDVVVFGEQGDSTGAAPDAKPILTATIEEILPDGNRIVRFTFDGIWEEVLNELGEMPLPPYITHKLQDKDRYQTVYARYEGSAAAPTAGLHFTKELLRKVQEKGVNLAYVTLHVGLGTFRPVKVENVKEHQMHSEWYQVTEETARLINETHEKGHRVICVGTTSCRTIESAAVRPGEIAAGSGDTSIFIYPGYRFKIMDGLITNFHLPESTLIMLVSAFAGREKVLSAYEEAVRERYRFFSFGDAMLIR